MKWRLKEKAPESFFKKFPEYSPQILQLLFDRGLKTQEEIDEFFSPDYKDDLHDPFLMKGMAEAVERIIKARKSGEKIAVFGDYDADGVCGAVILKTVFEALGLNLTGIYLPSRDKEGYGLNLKIIEELAKNGVKLIVTVDCGVSDLEEIESANSLGLEVLVLDHHRVPKKMPPAKVLVDPFQEGDKYPFKELAAAGVAFKFVQALLEKAEHDLKEGWEKWLLDLVALATVADCMKMLGENRTLVRYGLVVLAQTQRIGLQELMKIARLSPTLEIKTLKTNLDAYSLGFVLGPRLNAAGRLHHASLAFELLTAENREEAKLLAKKIDDHNRQRQKITDEIFTEIEERLKNKEFDPKKPVVVEKGKNWPVGIVGLVAGRVADRRHRPAFVFSEDGEILKGSARSIPAFNLVEALEACQELLDGFGGHPAAAGLRIKKENLEAFDKKINEWANKKIKEEDLVPEIEIDLEIKDEEISWKLFDDLMRFEPFGQGNGAPVFLARNFKIKSLKQVGNGLKHLKLELESEKTGKIFGAIGFGMVKNGGKELKKGDKIDLVFELLADEWNGTRNLQLKIIDFKIST